MTDNPFQPWWREPPASRIQTLAAAWDSAHNGATMFHRRTGAEALLSLIIPALRQSPLAPEATELEKKAKHYWSRHEPHDDAALAELLPLVDELTELLRT